MYTSRPKGQRLKKRAKCRKKSQTAEGGGTRHGSWKIGPVAIRYAPLGGATGRDLAPLAVKNGRNRSDVTAGRNNELGIRSTNWR
ncbi:Hypothetical protein NTJ_01931 [Nesidiocoris tenuis]|uniref:Uncharacterized protein n=1 Tax=Nesidiocoris tenuis TaxID=355587 RepID=A0ABN7A9Y6_9HEMI|nr:Hypothetical protein NTJ_01931 [Nesidiocoris tenuis]